MTLAALDRPASLVEAVCHRLAVLIRRGGTGGEGWLPAERALAEQLGVSRSVVREATKRLEQQGLLEVQHGNGIKIVDRLHRPLNEALSLLLPDMADRLRQLNETRLALEPEVAALAAQRATRTQLRTLRRLHEELQAAADNDAAIRCDLAFHHALAEAGGNQICQLMLDSFGELGLASRRRTIGRIGKQVAIEHHEAILRAVEQRDPEAARAAMQAHIRAAGEHMGLPMAKPKRSTK